MIIIKLQGGLGNQLYEYALYRKLQEMGKDVYLDDIDYTSRAFVRDIREIELTDIGLGDRLRFCSLRQHYRLNDDGRTFMFRVKRKVFGNHSRVLKDTEKYMPEVFDKDNIYLDGFWQCQKYYEDIIPKLQQEIDFGHKFGEQTAQMLKLIREDDSSVSLHIRLTDYVAKAATYGGICTDEYYRSAISVIKQHIEFPHFYLFSDDVREADRVAREWNINYTIVDCNTGANSRYDMMLMAECRHNICANSSFSIWGATLNKNAGKMMIKPLKANNEIEGDINTALSEWKDWLIIDEKGRMYGEK